MYYRTQLTTLLFLTTSTQAWAGLAHSPVVLMYHDIVDSPSDATATSDITKDELIKQLQALKAQGYVSMSADELYLAKANQTPIPPKRVVLTFDDGYSGIFRNAFQALHDAGMKASFFVHTNYVNKPAAGPGSRDHVTWEHLKQMEADPLFKVYSHTLTHRRLTTLSDEDLTTELQLSQLKVQKELLGERDYFAYPYGDHDPRVAEQTSLYYSMAFAVGDPVQQIEGLQDFYQVPRMIMNRDCGDTAAFLARVKNWETPSQPEIAGDPKKPTSSARQPSESSHKGGNRGRGHEHAKLSVHPGARAS